MRWLDRAHHDTQADAVVFKDKLISTFVFVLSCLAWSCAMFVPVWKVVDTSYLFRVSTKIHDGGAVLEYYFILYLNITTYGEQSIMAGARRSESL
jgi:hypothetical protein